jgi:alpha-glucosidase
LNQEQSKPRSWLADAVVYQIYPQSFADSNGDGIGDFPGVLSRLDYLQWLGIDTIWFNPCFVSPHRDAGYDVADYFKVDPRYGTNADLEQLIDEAKRRGIRVLLDLVVGHTSDEHPWFVAEANSAATGRYIWAESPPATNEVGVLGTSAWVPSPGARPGHYLKNFFDSQPALNFGYATSDDSQPWRMTPADPGPRRNIESLKQIMGFWLDRGVAGFRVDMAFSLVKDDPTLQATLDVWREITEWLHHTYPYAVLIPEGVEPLDRSATFDADFFLVIGDQHRALFTNGGAGTLPWHDGSPCYFDSAGNGDFQRFLTTWREHRASRPDHPVLLGTADHDYSRLVCGDRDGEQAAAAMVFLFTWGTVPSLYYGDEIGMRYLPDVPAVEGSECFPGCYNRAGARTPMQWSGEPNAGFSEARADQLYLPIDADARRPTVADQREDPSSLLNLVRQLIGLHRQLASTPEPEVLADGYPLVFRRGQYLVMVNPSGTHRDVAAQQNVSRWHNCEWIINSGASWHGLTLACRPFSYAVGVIAEE